MSLKRYGAFSDWRRLVSELIDNAVIRFPDPTAKPLRNGKNFVVAPPFLESVLHPFCSLRTTIREAVECVSCNAVRVTGLNLKKKDRAV